MSRVTLVIGIALCVVLVVILSRQLVERPDGSGTMRIANGLYEQGRFVEAAQLYQQLADGGYGGIAVFYNLGNAYYKSGDLGRAILNYLRASRLAPRDTDIEDNLRIAREATVDLLETDNGSVTSTSIELPELKLAPDELALAALGLWILLTLMLLVLLLFRRFSLRRWIGYASVFVALLLLLGTASLGSRLYSEAEDQRMVVVAESVDVVGGPGLQYEAQFTLHSGAEASLIESRGVWTRLQLEGGQLQGWVPADAVEFVDSPP